MNVLENPIDNAAARAAIRSQLASAKITQKSLANLLGVSENTVVNKMHAPLERFSVAEFIKIADYLGCSVPSLIGMDE